jgi:hypothetical protein
MSADNQKNFETRAVLAGAYLSGSRTLLTHTVELDANGFEIRVLCNRVQLDSLADPYALSETDRKAQPTCKTCLKRMA